MKLKLISRDFSRSPWCTRKNPISNEYRLYQMDYSSFPTRDTTNISQNRQKLFSSTGSYFEYFWILNETLRDSSKFYRISVISNGFRKLEFLIKGHVHVSFSQSEAKCPLIRDSRCNFRNIFRYNFLHLTNPRPY